MTTRYDHEVFALREQLDWQPIETAPKDGTTVLGYTPGASCLFGDVYFDVEQEHWKRLPFDGRIYPTHWRPLPDPPKVTP